MAKNDGPKVDATNSEWQAMAKKWKRCRAVMDPDIIKGDDAEDFIPRPNALSDAQYQAYLKRGLLYMAFSRSVAAFTGAVFRKQYKLAVPPALERNELWRNLIENADNMGTDLTGFVRQMFHEQVAVGRIGILVDHTRLGQPYFSGYPAESILPPKIEIINGTPVVTVLRLKETYMIQEDEYSEVPDEQIRSFELDADEETDPESWQVVMKLWRKSEDDKNKDKFEVVEEVVLTYRDKPINEIPFVVCNAGDTRPDLSQPPMIGLADANISHIQLDCDHCHGLHLTSIPTPWAAGFGTIPKKPGDNADKAVLELGGLRAWVARDPQARAGMLEFSGAGMAALLDKLKAREDEMARQGSQVLEGKRGGVEKAETAKIRQSGEISGLSLLAVTMSEAITKALRIAASRLGVVGDQLKEISFELNNDFLAEMISGKDARDWMEVWLKGGIGHADFFDLLKRGEALRPGREFEEMKDEIDAEVSVGLGEPMDQSEKPKQE